MSLFTGTLLVQIAGTLYVSTDNQLRKVTKNKRVFPSDESVFKTLYLTIDYITRKWILPIRDWNEAMAHFLIKFDDRIQINN